MNRRGAHRAPPCWCGSARLWHPPNPGRHSPFCSTVRLVPVAGCSPHSQCSQRLLIGATLALLHCRCCRCRRWRWPRGRRARKAKAHTVASPCCRHSAGPTATRGLSLKFALFQLPEFLFMDPNSRFEILTKFKLSMAVGATFEILFEYFEFD